MPDGLEEIPANVAPATEDGINDAIEAYVTNEGRARTLANQLEQNPRAVIRRALSLNRYQRAALMEQSDQETRELVAPLVEALRGPNPMGFRVRYREEVVARSPLTLRCELEIEPGPIV